ncbi:MAG: IS1634 family transposase [Deltaproteobacteria bacterium]|jgi:hypothetical protein|nr:IS1634 family transposase [Deltaproteobacteria bacterium]MBT6502952.1 IS1634 family transposase [Deltaproteobacteria bacterium]
MYIKQVTHRSKKNDKQYHTYKIVESVRTEAGPRQRELLNLGSRFELSKERWKELCELISLRLSGNSQISFLAADRELVDLSERLVHKILAKKSTAVKSSGQAVTIRKGSLNVSNLRSIGGEHLCYEMIKRLKLDTKLSELGFNQKQVNLALGSIIGRMLHPGSERATFEWLQRQSGLSELLDFDYQDASLNRFYEVSDQLLSKKQDLEEHLYQQEKALYRLDQTIVLYDLTNTFMEGSGKYNSKAKRGRSKEKRSDAPLVTLGLVLDNTGFPKRSEIFPGNISEPGTLEVILDKLEHDQTDIFNKTVVVDAGIATTGNLDWLSEKGYQYIVVSRTDKKLFEHDEYRILKESSSGTIKGKLQRSDDKKTWKLYCHSSRKQQKEEGIKTLFEERLVEDLTRVDQSLNKKYGTKRYEKVIEKLGRLKQKYSRVSSLYEITVIPDKNKQFATKVRWKRKEEKAKDKLNGTYCLKTNQENPKAEEMLRVYLMLTQVESAFESMKSHLGMRPLYHQIEHRVDGHIFITLLAYHVMHSIRYALGQQGIDNNWHTIRTWLVNHMRATVSYIDIADAKTFIRKTSEAEEIHKMVYSAFGVSDSPGSTRETTVDLKRSGKIRTSSGFI